MSPSLSSTLFPLCTFILSIATLERSTTTLLTATTHLSTRLHIPETLIALLTAGAEWEELAVVVAACSQGAPHLALGNILGSCVANVLGAFSLGVLAQRESFVRYDASARRYAVLLFVVTTVVAGLIGIGRLEAKVLGVMLVVVFVVYFVGVAWSIYRGVLVAPVDSDDESEDGSSDSDSDEEGESHSQEPRSAEEANEITPLTGRRKSRPSTLVHLAKLIISFVGLSISGYVLSHSSQELTSSFNISETVFGATLLSLATTLPEKFVAVISGYRGHPGIMVANTVGSNIFLLTLCLGVTILSSQDLAQSSTYTHEVVWTWGASALLMVLVIFGTHRLVGLALVLAYFAFLALEFTLYKK